MFLLRVTLTVMGGVALAIVIAVLIGYARPAPDRVTMLHLDMCKPPCWIGITPGVTTLDEAEQRIKEVLLKSQYKFAFSRSDTELDFTIQDLNTNPMFTVHIGSIESIVTFIALIPETKGDSKPLLTFAELSAVWGSPRYIGIWSCDGIWRPYYNKAIDSYILVYPPYTGFLSPDAKIGWNSKVMTIQFFVPGQDLVAENNYHYWQGYISYRRYGYDESNFGACPMP